MSYTSTTYPAFDKSEPFFTNGVVSKERAAVVIFDLVCRDIAKAAEEGDWAATRGLTPIYRYLFNIVEGVASE